MWKLLNSDKDISELFCSKLNRKVIKNLSDSDIVNDIDEYITYISRHENFIVSLTHSLINMYSVSKYLPASNNFFFRHYLFNNVVFRATIKPQHIDYIKICTNNKGLHIYHVNRAMFDFYYM